MKISILNNWQVKRHFSNNFWYRYGIMFPWDHRKYLQLGIFGIIFMFQWGSYKFDKVSRWGYAEPCPPRQNN